MVDEKDIYRSAWQLIKAHGAEAKAEAMRLHNRVAMKGDAEGTVTWARIMAAIDVLGNEQSPLQDH